MVDISQKLPTRRSAAAIAFVLFSNRNPYASLTDNTLPKGDAIAVARIAGIQAAKKTADLVPLSHPGLGITGVKVDIALLEPAATNQDQGRKSDLHTTEGEVEFGGVKITAHVSCDGKTGVEMEALTAANVAALTIYDMCKSVDKHMLITGIRVIKKTGGKSGGWVLDGPSMV
jgi:molybdenum cofactor biosynthesis enzyme